MTATLKAYHIIGADAGDQSRLSDPALADQVIEALADKHHKIISSKFLRPASTMPGSRAGRMFALDRFAGDDQYVFLSLGQRYWLEPNRANFGFVFDVEKLIAGGAILRKQDLLSSYEDLLDKVARKFTPADRDVAEWTEEEKAELMRAVADPYAYPDYVSPNDQYLSLISDIERQNLSNPLVVAATADLKQAITALQAKKQLTGEAALEEARRDSGSGNYEILVPGKLAVKEAAAYIKYGEEVAPGRGGRRLTGARPGRPATDPNDKSWMSLHHFWAGNVVEELDLLTSLLEERQLSRAELAAIIREAASEGVQARMESYRAKLEKQGVTVTKGGGAIII